MSGQGTDSINNTTARVLLKIKSAFLLHHHSLAAAFSSIIITGGRQVYCDEFVGDRMKIYYMAKWESIYFTAFLFF